MTCRSGRILGVLSLLGLVSVTFAGCQGGGAFPSYAGTYELQGEPEIVLTGAEEWPYTPLIPQTIQVVQDVFGRPDGILNEVRLAVGTDEPGLFGKLALLNSRNGEQEVGRTLLPYGRWDDVNSPFVSGIEAGHVCHYQVGASMVLRISPEPFALVNLYPGTYSSDPTLAPPVDGAWPTPTLTLTFEAGKYNDAYPEFPCARVVAGNYRLTLRYQRVFANESVDLRFAAPQSLRADWEEMEARTDVTSVIFPVPETRNELVEVFGR